MSAVVELDGLLQRLETFGVRLGLDTTHRLLSALGEPQRPLRVVLVGGTNGKGSTAAFLSSMAATAGYRTGLYTSPHLETVEERLRIDGRAITTDRLASIVKHVVATAEKSLGYLPTYFEVLTAAACQWFAEESVDLAVLEVGLGGRLDATNGTDPALSLITEIGLEHQKYLGSTLAQIAREKAGILRPDRDAIAWVEREEARAAIQQVAGDIGARLVWGPQVATFNQVGEYRRDGQLVELSTPGGNQVLNVPLLGEHQGANLALAALAVENLARQGMDRLGAESVKEGVARTRWPGRLEWVEPAGVRPFLLDVAHNPDGGRMLERALEQTTGHFTLVFGALSDKEVRALLPGLASRASRVVLTRPVSSRALDPGVLAELLPDREVSIHPEISAALDSALESTGDFVLACGSVYLVGEVRLELRRRFGIPAPATDNLLPFQRSGVDAQDSVG
jgi:dihydrofolate synthase/folylpolyglutamate synthase